MTDTSHSLLLRAGAGDPAAWERFDALYRPLVRGWLIRHQVHPQEADDLTQDVLFAVVRGIERFEHTGEAGSFRRWLRTITVNRARAFWRAGRCRGVAPGGDAFLSAIAQLEDPASGLSAEWDREHDETVLRRLLELLGAEFEPQTMQAFRQLVFERRTGADVADELGMTLAAVYAAKSRVLHRLRAEAGELLA
jgi:RNA polymerase sigma-70 factor (ECF subfamily)